MTLGSNNGALEGLHPNDNKTSCISRNAGTVISELPVYNESNRVQKSGVYPCWMTWGKGASVLEHGSNTNLDHVIVRNNIFYGNAGGVSNESSGSRIYNNTILGNNTTFASTNSPNMAGFSYDGASNTIFKNNILGGNNGGDVQYKNGLTPQRSKLDMSNNLYWGSSPDSFDQNAQQGNPNLANISTNKPTGVHPFSDFYLTSNSQKAIDKGAFLTKVVSVSGNKIKVTDPYLFTDGYGIVKGDTIAIKTSGGKKAAVITNIDYAGKWLTLDSMPSGVANNDLVSLDYTGSAPDIGAHNYKGSTITPITTPSPTPTPTFNPKFDLNDDGKVDIKDLIELIKFIFG